MDFLSNHIEALIFCSPKPITDKELKNCLSEMFEADVPMKDIEEAILSLQQKYSDNSYSFEPLLSGGGYQFLTKPAYQASIGILLKQQSKKRLSNSALETLSIIAYKQPVTKGDLEQIRGVSCDYSVQKLLEKELIEIKGKSEAVGRPLIYGTSENFTDYFGINSISELPTIKDFEQKDNEIGDSQE
ncbi:SMC-Scp complex subunit ScpB [Reichenbachiella agariperforans]|nr:SMC-Scp complex subunit ScpB [Reichenbachiella agariperforans]